MLWGYFKKQRGIRSREKPRDVEIWQFTHTKVRSRFSSSLAFVTAALNGSSYNLMQKHCWGNRCCNLCLNLVLRLHALGCSSGSYWGLADWFLSWWAGICREDIDLCKAGHIMSQDNKQLNSGFQRYLWMKLGSVSLQPPAISYDVQRVNFSPLFLSPRFWHILEKQAL